MRAWWLWWLTWRKYRRNIIAGRVLGILLAKPNDRHYSTDIGKQAHVRSGRLYPALDQLLDGGWITDGWDDGPYPRRRYYELSETRWNL